MHPFLTLSLPLAQYNLGERRQKRISNTNPLLHRDPGRDKRETVAQKMPLSQSPYFFSLNVGRTMDDSS